MKGAQQVRVVYEFGEFSLDTEQRRLVSTADGRLVPLSRRAFEALLYFLEHPGQLLDKATLLRAIWPATVVEENNLNQSISVLRRALGDESREHRYVATVPGRGYQFIAAVRAIKPAALHTSVAVLPFSNLTGDPGKAYFSDGIAEELINVLGRLPGIKVSARTSSFAYNGKNMDVRQIARDLDVASVLEGSVRSAGDRIRVSVQLVDAQSGFHIWSQSYDREFVDLFKLQDELAAAIVQALRANIGDPPAHLSRASTSDLDAYQLYLKARSVPMSGGIENALSRQSEYYLKAITLDPSFARAHAGLADVRNLSVVMGYRWPDALTDGQRAAEKAVALDPSLAEGYAVLANNKAMQGEWLEAEDHFDLALSLSRDPMTLRSHALYIAFSTGQLRRALEEARESYRLAPAVPLAANALASALSVLGLNSEALRYAEIAVTLGHSRADRPLCFVHADASIAEGQYAAAAEHVINGMPDALRAANGAEVVRQVFMGLADESRRDAAVAALRALTEKTGLAIMDPFTVGFVMIWFARLGALDLAYEVANRVIDELPRAGGSRPTWVALWKPEMREFRRDPRLRALVTRLGLMAYWKRYGPPDAGEWRDGELLFA
jgi:TolB-like protein